MGGDTPPRVLILSSKGAGENIGVRTVWAGKGGGNWPPRFWIMLEFGHIDHDIRAFKTEISIIQT